MNSNARDQITSPASQGTPAGGSVRRLRAATLSALLVGAGGSVALMLRAGRRNTSPLLIVLFACWVLSPFIALAFAAIASKRWSTRTRVTLYGIILVVTLGSLALYGAVALGPPRTRTASVFVVVPPASWLLMVVTLALAAVVSRGRTGRRDGA